MSKCLDGLRGGDTLVIHELDRLGRSMVEMRQRGDGYGTIASAMGMTASMVRRIIQQQEVSA